MELIYFFYFLIFILVLYISNVETLENTKTKLLTVEAPCKNCNIWNHRDAKTKCNSNCKKIDQDKPYKFTGEWEKNQNKLQDSTCKCSKVGNFNKHYVGCALGNNCFLWNNSDSKTICPKMCNQYLPNKKAEWTGNWKSTSIDSSACECQYYY